MLQLLTSIIMTLSLAHAKPENLEIVVGGKTTKLSLSEMTKKLKPLNIEIDDPVYKQKKSFDGFLLSDVLALGGVTDQTTADEILFTAKDGYTPNMSFEALKKHKAYLVYQEHGGKAGYFGMVTSGKSKVSPAPYYIIWDEGAKLQHEVPWAYQLVKIEIAKFSEKYADAFPSGAAENSPEKKGFLTFKAECLRCHSINLQGGELGPELNAPKSVTEYWKTEHLEAFIKDAPSFRYKTKMPSFNHLSREQIDQIIFYLRHMARNKKKL